MGIFVKEFMILYENKELPSLKLQYKDFSQWQNKVMKSEEIRNQEEYWLKQFAGYRPVHKIPTDYPRPKVQSFEGASIRFEISRKEAQQLKNLAAEEEATLFMVLLAIFSVFLSKLSGSEDIVAATVTAGRQHADLEQMIGMFANTLALRNYPAGEKSFRAFLKEVKKRTLEAFENQMYQFEDLVEQVTKNNNMDRNSLCDVGIGLQNITVSELRIPGLKLTPREYEAKVSRVDLALTAEETGEELNFCIEYSMSLFKPETIKKIAIYFKEIVSSVIKNNDVKLKDIRISHGLFDQKINNHQIKFDF
jgi:non-ribosomal peptide synthetase component F